VGVLRKWWGESILGYKQCAAYHEYIVAATARATLEEKDKLTQTEEYNQIVG
jgi:hypothetical protein